MYHHTQLTERKVEEIQMTHAAKAHGDACREHHGLRCLGHYEVVYHVFPRGKAAGIVRACNLCGCEEFSGDPFGDSVKGKLTALKQSVQLVARPSVKVYQTELKKLQRHGLLAEDVSTMNGDQLDIMLHPRPQPQDKKPQIPFAEPQHQGLAHTKISAVPMHDVLGVTLGAPNPLRAIAGSSGWASPMRTRRNRGLGGPPETHTV